MELDLIRNNIAKQIEITNKIIFANQEVLKIESENKTSKKIKVLGDSVKELFLQLKVINNSLPQLLNGLRFYKNLNETQGNEKDRKVKIDDKKKEDDKKIIQVNYNSFDKKENLAIKKEDHMKYLKSLTSYDALEKKLDSNPLSDINQYIVLANGLFRNISKKMVDKGYFNSLKQDLRKITSPFLIDTYISLVLFLTSISFIFSLVISIILFVFNAGFLISFAVFFIIPLIVFILSLTYPSSKKKSLEKEINQELPFMVIYTAAISTSGIEPSKIFEIIISSEDYPFIKREIKKLTNYINFYGYDLVSALKMVAKNSPSERLAQLLDGLATTITSGGDMTVYLNKHAESLLFDYRLEREKYTHIAETFMNIYISVVIAAPMILMVLFILMSLWDNGLGLSVVVISSLTVLIVSLLNIGFLVFLNLKQPKF
jgi:pilus assembly protein TadC